LSDDGISSSALRDGVTLDAGTTGAAFKDYTWDRKWVDGPDGSRVRVPGAYVRDVTGITQTGEVKLTVSLPGYIITPPDWHTVTVYAGPTEPEEPEDPNVETFTSTADLKTWLQAQPDNTPATAYKVKLNLSSITGIRDALGNAAGTKFVRLDLSGSTITGLGNECFYGSYPGGTPALVGITMPSKSTGIGYYTFRDCANLASVSIPNGVTFIGERAFYGCTSLTSVNIPNSVTTIYNSAFNFCSNLASVTIPNSVTSIGDTAFQSCKNLASVTIGNGVTSIGDMAFENCTSLTSVTIPGSVTSIGASVFEDCTSLTSVTIRNGVTTIPWGNFNGCTSLTSVSIPDSVTSIGGNAFYGCTSLASVTIGNSVTTIGRFAFFGCTSLTSATIPASVTTIEEGAFWGCTSLTSVTFATGSNIPNFGSRAFPEGRNGDGGNDLRLRYSIDKAGTYTRSATGSTWGWR
ncbi:MAG: leucine-rich repeat domain-containing protein, partial [Spirochaetaceae bacterium]|jgi:hypothetical protein|nr:leucine-rich repeat domain-containing protein [Spirochaetaceae bacterium]